MGNELFALLFAMYYLLYVPPSPGLCPPDMTYIPPGEFVIGSPRSNQSPFHRIVTPSYCADTYEYPNLKGEMPLTNVDWEEAERYCESVGKRLCTEAEWEKACRGTKGQNFSYGRHYDKHACGDEFRQAGQTFPSGYFAGCKSIYGVYDMSGGVAEWTADAYAPYPGNKTERPSTKSHLEKTIRSLPYKESYCSNRKGVVWSKKWIGISFRCCLSFDEAENERIKSRIWHDLARY